MVASDNLDAAFLVAKATARRKCDDRFNTLWERKSISARSAFDEVGRPGRS
jgi:hypothetical protein